jgi:hypothetical protein
MKMPSYTRLAIGTALVLGGLLAAVWAGRASATFTLPGDDPLLDYLTRRHSADYAGIDRWAYAGMPAAQLTSRLGAAGYTCSAPGAAPGAARPAGIQAIGCTRQLAWPVARTLTIRADIDGDRRARLVALVASSAGPEQALGRRFTAWLRERHWIEAATLTASGIGVESADTLALYALDAIGPHGWAANCGPVDGQGARSGACADMARARRAEGLPALPPGPVPVPEALDLPALLEHAHLLPLTARGADTLPPDTLLVRVESDLVWLDVAWRDLAGRSAEVAIGLDIEGGTPRRLVARVGKERKELALAGRARRNNNDTPMLLVPLAGSAGAQPGMWLQKPDPNYPVTLAKLAESVPRLDPRFAARVVHSLVGSVAAASRPDEMLGLYPPLQVIERRAAILRAANAARWLAPAQAAQLIRQAFAEDPAMRAAWALATCAPAPQAASIEPLCWASFAQADPAAAGFVRTEVDTRQILYSGLDASNPVRLHLQELSKAMGGRLFQADGSD